MKYPSLFLLVILLAFNNSCGRWASASEQSVDTLPAPEYPKVGDDVFSLNSRKPDTTYRTTLLVINENADPALLGEVINASEYSREVFARARRFEVDHDYKNLYSDTGLEPETVEMMKKDLNTFELSQLQKNPMKLEQRKVNIKNWFDQKVDTLPFDPAQRALFDQAWGAYCEAKIIELASNSVFAASTYKELPTPQPLCADYYASAGLLMGTSCQKPKDGNFFSCLWQEGVANTRWFQPPAAPTPGSSAEDSAAYETAKSEMAQKNTQLQNLLKKSDAGFQKVIALDPSKVSINSNPVKNKITPNFFTSIFTQQLTKEPGNNVTWCSVPPFGIKDRSLSGICTLFGLAPLPVSPAAWIDAFEGRSARGELINIPAPSEPSQPTFEQFLRYLAERDKGRTSEADRLFHAPIQSVSPLETPSYDSSGLEFKILLDSLRSELAEVLYGSLDESAIAEKVLRVKNINYREVKIAEMQAESNILESETEVAINRGLKATNAPGVAHGFLEIRFHFKQLGSIIGGEFWHKDAEIGSRPIGLFRACYDLTFNQGIDCPAEFALDDSEETRVFPAKLNRDPETGQINMAMLIDDPESVALRNKPRANLREGETPNYFMDLDASVFKGRQLRFELFPNRLEDELDILTGKVFLEEGARVLYEGGISGWEIWD